YMKANDIELVVMARRKHSPARLVFGSVGERLLTLTDRPVLFVPVRSRNLRLNHSRLLVPLDGSANAEGALSEAATLAALTGGSITLLRVIAPGSTTRAPTYHQDGPTEDAVARALEAQRYLDRMAERVRGAGLLVERTV